MCLRKEFSLAIFITLVVFVPLLAYFNSHVYSKIEREIILKQYTPVILVLRENVSSVDKKPGDKVQMAVLEDVIVDGETLIKSGTPVIGKLSVAREAASLGEPGEIAIVPQHVDTIDGQKVRLGGTLYMRGEDEEVSTAVLTAVCLPFALRKGGQAIVVDGTELKAYVERDYIVKITE